MSAKDAECQSQLVHSQYTLDSASYRCDYPSQPIYREDSGTFPHEPSELRLRSDRSFSYLQGIYNGLEEQGSLSKTSSGSHVSYGYPFPQQMQSAGSDTLPAETSASLMPRDSTDRLTPHSPETSAQVQEDDEEMVDSGGEDDDEGLDKAEMTPAEIRAQKRKMKRHRFATGLLIDQRTVALTL
jgi:hypothetical protein